MSVYGIGSLIDQPSMPASFPHQDAERMLLDLTGGRRRIALIYDADGGWCVTEEVDDPSPADTSARVYRVTCFGHCFERTLADAMATADAIRRGRGSLSDISPPEG